MDLQLIPLRSGLLQVPRIAAWPLPPTTSAADDADMLPYLPSCEVHQANAAQRVEVIEQERHSSFWVPTA